MRRFYHKTQVGLARPTCGRSWRRRTRYWLGVRPAAACSTDTSASQTARKLARRSPRPAAFPGGPAEFRRASEIQRRISGSLIFCAYCVANSMRFSSCVPMAGIGGKHPSRAVPDGLAGGPGRVHHQLGEQVEVGIDVGLTWKRLGRWLLVGALDQPDRCLVSEEFAGIRLGPVQVGLQRDSDVLVALFSHLLAQANRLIRVGRVLHVDTDEVAELLRLRQDAFQILAADAFIQCESDLGQLDRYVRAKSGLLDGGQCPDNRLCRIRRPLQPLLVCSPR